MENKWTFWIDCGGTFTDIVAINDLGEHRVHKLLSKSPHYESVVVQGISDILGHTNFSEYIREIRLGTTVATNAFLEKKGIPCALVTTLGQRDVLEIKQQNRPDLFAIDIEKHKPLYSYVTHIQGRMDSKGNVLEPLDLEIAQFEFQRILDKGIKSLAISLMHATINPEHEKTLKSLALDMGFEYVSASHEVSPISKYIARTETTVTDCYLSPLLKQYTDDLEKRLGVKHIYYMQSDGNLCQGINLKGHNSLLSGPAGGLIGAIDAANEIGHKKIITFDMGGTSTDVAIYSGELNIDTEPDFYGVKLLAPMVNIHTVAAGGGSILKYDKGRFIVGPESAGAYPGPACYRNGGPLTVTDANLFLKRIDIEKFPKVFGPTRDQSLDIEITKKKFEELSKEIGIPAKQVAEGFLDVAVETMSRAIRFISIESGFDPSEFTLMSFGGAGGQLAARVAENLNIKTVFVHPFSSVLSAYGIGKAAHGMSFYAKKEVGHERLKERAKSEFPFKEYECENYFMLSAKGSDHEVQIRAKDEQKAQDKFKNYYKRVFGIDSPSSIHCESIVLKIKRTHNLKVKLSETAPRALKGLSIISENNTSIVVEDNWDASQNKDGSWILNYSNKKTDEKKRDESIDLEIFYQRFQFIAEQMGSTLKKLARSVNIKERNDFSCALFTESGDLIANAPHIPVHLGSMGETVKSIIDEFEFEKGDSFICNSPHYGGTHLPDITIVTPVYNESDLIMWVASRGHHADIGGISPGSMPGNSKSLQEEGVIIAPTKIAKDGSLNKSRLKEILESGKYPVRNYPLNEHDIEAKLAANMKGASEILSLTKSYGKDYLNKMSANILNYSEVKTKEALKDLSETKALKKITNSRQISLELKKDKDAKDKVTFDFHGTSAIQEDNFNAPIPVVKATVLFALRCLIKEKIPLNSGIMRAVNLVIPPHSMLSPDKDSPVVAGNVETSQALCDLLFEVLKIRAHSHGSMNNLSFGNDKYQYYETLAGGHGASFRRDGASAVQTNMTNSLLTDPEILETRFPVIVELMGIRHGSGGQGQFVGGDGIYRRIKFLEPMEVSMLTQSRLIPPKGLEGGEEGKRGLNQVIKDGELHELPESFYQKMKPFESIYISTPGGGGFGQDKTPHENLIFGFGSNMDISQIKSRCPSAKLICRARVYDKEIRYTSYSHVRKGGVADMYHAPGHIVYGLVVSINNEDLVKLDEIECNKNEYRRIQIEAIDDNNNKLDCFCYDVIDKKPDIPPTKVYEWLVYSGAYSLNVSDSYLSKIRSYRED